MDYLKTSLENWLNIGNLGDVNSFLHFHSETVDELQPRGVQSIQHLMTCRTEKPHSNNPECPVLGVELEENKNQGGSSFKQTSLLHLSRQFGDHIVVKELLVGMSHM